MLINGLRLVFSDASTTTTTTTPAPPAPPAPAQDFLPAAKTLTGKQSAVGGD